MLFYLIENLLIKTFTEKEQYYKRIKEIFTNNFTILVQMVKSKYDPFRLTDHTSVAQIRHWKFLTNPGFFWANNT